MDEGEQSVNRPAASSVSPQGKGLRLWPVGLILLVAVAAEMWIWKTNESNHQELNIRSAAVGMATFLLLAVWAVFFSRLPRRFRYGLGSALVVLIAAGATLVRIRGVTGDLLPVFEWRWKAPASQVLAKEPTASSAPAAAASFERPFTNDYPQFLGPHRNATIDGPPLARDWQAQPPKLIWRRTVGTGWSGFAVAGRRAVTQEQRGENETVTCYDLFTGKPAWSHADTAHFTSRLAGEGPRATPTILSNRVYTVGATGILNCLDLTSGRLEWSKNLMADNHSDLPEWGMSGSPLLMGDVVVVSPGGSNGRSLVAYRTDNGDFIWGGGEWPAGYSSPCMAELGGVCQVLIFNGRGLVAHSPDTGNVLWSHPWPGRHPHVAMPLLLPGSRVMISSGYGTGSEMLQIQRTSNGVFSAASLWKSRRLKAKLTNVVFYQGYIYGLDDGILACLDAATGAQQWKDGRYGHGQVILDRDLLLLMAENGELVLIEPVPQERRELTRFAALSNKTWNPPALAGRYLLVRNDKEAACYDMPVSR